MKKKKAVLAALACLVLAGCGQNAASGGWKASENSIYVTKDLSVESAMVYTAEKANDLYTQDGLESYAQAAVVSYNKEQGAAEAFEKGGEGQKLPVALKDCKLEGETGTLVFEYGSAEDFVKFAEATGDNTHSITELQVGTAAELKDEFSDLTFQTAEGKAAEASAVTGAADQKAVVTEGAGVVYVEGTITFVSDGVKVKSSEAAIVPEGANCIVFQ